MLCIIVQYRVVDQKAPSAYYRLTDHRAQIRSYVFDVIRSNVPRLELDQAFESKDDVAKAVKDQLSALMQEYGYEILGTQSLPLESYLTQTSRIGDRFEP